MLTEKLIKDVLVSLNGKIQRRHESFIPEMVAHQLTILIGRFLWHDRNYSGNNWETYNVYIDDDRTRAAVTIGASTETDRGTLVSVVMDSAKMDNAKEILCWFYGIEDYEWLSPHNTD